MIELLRKRRTQRGHPQDRLDFSKIRRNRYQ
jgi:hypothetical protein